MPSKPYHHGDLELAIIQAAITFIETKGAESLSLRTIAKECGVSATAIYRHFANKEALFAKIATEGFKKLSQVGEFMEATNTQSNIFGVGYVEFALDNRGYFEIMFGSHIKDHRLYPELYQASQNSFTRLSEKIATNTKDINKEQLNAMAKKHWALVHGLAILMATHYIDYTPENRRQVIEKILGG